MEKGLIMINWEKSAKINNCDINDLKLKFEKFPKSSKNIIINCDKCGKERKCHKKDYRSLCGSCACKNRNGKNNSNWKQKIILICKQCNKKFEVIPSLKNKPFCSQTCYNKWLSINTAGEKSIFWIGGLSFGKYCYKFNESLKQQIRNQYNNCDYISGIHKDICSPNQELSVHHVNYDKQCGCNESKCKLIPLCASNHIRTNFNRSFWNRLFKYSLKIDEELYND